MAKVKRFKKPETSLIQWNEEEGLYETMCGACKQMICSLTLKDMRRIFLAHTRGMNCLGGY